jgi:two-component system sensor histidine kinase DesK
MSDAIENAADRRPPWEWAASIFGLLWIGLPVADLVVNEDPSAWAVVLVGLALIAFASQFLIVVMTTRPLREPLLAMVAISVALTLAAIDSFGLLFIYTASAASVRLEGRASALVVAAITAVAAATLALTDPESGLFWGVTAAVVATGALWMLIGGLLRTNAALREARAELAELAVAEERVRFARDMHDLLGHDLSLIAIKAELAGKLLARDSERAAAEIGDIRSLSRTALVQVREAVDGYRRPTLPSELAGARVALDAAGIELEVDVPETELDAEIEAVLAWAVREGATNVIRHSGARHAEITVTPTSLEIADDGHGDRRADGSRHGLDGLRERVEAIGGSVEAGDGPDGGFRLRVSVPAREAAAA